MSVLDNANTLHYHEHMKKTYPYLLLLVGNLITGCTIRQVDEGTLQVAATFYPLAYIAEQVGGDRVQVTTIVPNGVEPHDFTPTPQDIVTMTQADVLLYNGAGLDTWAADIPETDFIQSDVHIIAATDTTATDPHVWLDPVLLQDIAQQVANAYAAIDPNHSVLYQKNADALITKLSALDAQFETTLATCAIRQAIVSHDAFNYLAERYAIELLPISGLNPNETPSAQTIAKLSELAKVYHIDYIFFEELTSPKLSETLANEVGAETLVLSPIEGLSEAEQTAGDNYVSVMERNLVNLALALRCQ